jgi:hypothetical protein
LVSFRALSQRTSVQKRILAGCGWWEGWERADRTVQKGRERLVDGESGGRLPERWTALPRGVDHARTSVWIAERRPPADDVAPSDTDPKRRLEAYIAVELRTNANEQARKHAKAALDFAVSLQHKRSATWRDAAMCLEATASIVALLAIVMEGATQGEHSLSGYVNPSAAR